MIYLDTSATVKLVTAEQESPALINWLNVHPDEHLATSAIGHIELIRAAARAGAAATAAGRISPGLLACARPAGDDGAEGNAVQGRVRDEGYPGGPFVLRFRRNLQYVAAGVGKSVA